LEKLETKMIKSIENRKQELSKLCSELIQAKGENPPGDVSEAAHTIERFLENEGINHQRFEPVNGHVSVVATVGKGKPTLILCGHIDVVPAGDFARWSVHPYKGEIREGKIVGRGATDQKGGVAAMLMAVAAVKEFEGEIRGRVSVASVSDEEALGPGGALWLLQNKKLAGDVCLITEPTGRLDGAYSIVAGERGTCWLKIKAHGKPAHGSTPVLGKNAVAMLTEFLPKLKMLESMVVKVPRDAERLVKNGRKELSWVAKKQVISVSHLARVLNHYTVNVGTIAGGTKVNVVPENCEAEIDIRVPPGGDQNGVEEFVRSVLPQDLTYEVINRTMPSYTLADNPLIRTVQQGAYRVFGYKPQPTYMAATSDAHHFRELLSLPTVAFGPGYVELAHAYDEFVYAKDLVNMSKVYTNVIADFVAHA